MSFSETIFLFFLALVIFGPKKLPEIARQVGKVLNEFRRASNEFKAQIEQEISHLELEERKRTMLAPSPTPENTTSRTLNSAGSELSSTQTAEASSTTAVPAEGGSSAVPATAAASDPEDEPLFAKASEAKPSETTAGEPKASAAEMLPPRSADAPSINSQESHA